MFIRVLWSCAISASLWVRDPKAFLKWQNTWSVLGPGHTDHAWSADPDRWMLRGIIIFHAGPMAGAAGTQNQVKITAGSTSLPHRAHPSDILMLGGFLLKSWDTLSLQEICGRTLEFHEVSWGSVWPGGMDWAQNQAKLLGTMTLLYWIFVWGDQSCLCQERYVKM